jgi:hypothetical protein
MPIVANEKETTMSEFTVTKARYAKGMMLVRAPSTDGFITTAARTLRDDLNCRFTNREGGYIASPRKVERFRKIMADMAAPSACAPL